MMRSSNGTGVEDAQRLDVVTALPELRQTSLAQALGRVRVIRVSDAVFRQLHGEPPVDVLWTGTLQTRGRLIAKPWWDLT